MPAIVVKTFGRGAETVGLFIGAVGLGAFIAAIQLAMRAQRARARQVDRPGAA